VTAYINQLITADREARQAEYTSAKALFDGR